MIYYFPSLFVSKYLFYLLRSQVRCGDVEPTLRSHADPFGTAHLQADQQLLASGQKATKLEEASRLLQKCFSCCLNDRYVFSLAASSFR